MSIDTATAKVESAPSGTQSLVFIALYSAPLEADPHRGLLIRHKAAAEFHRYIFLGCSVAEVC